MSPASNPPAESLPPESSGAPKDDRSDVTLPDMLPEHRAAKAALPSVLPAAGTPAPGTPGPSTFGPGTPAPSTFGQNPAAPADYPYGSGTSPDPGNADSFTGGAYHGPTGDGYSHDYAESVYVEPSRDEPRYEEPRYEEPRQARVNDGPQEADSWFTSPDLPKLDHQDQGFQAPQHRQDGYQGGGIASQQPAPPPVPPNAQGYPDQSAAGYPGPTGGYPAQVAPQFGNGYPGPGRPATDSPPSPAFPPQESFQPQENFPPVNGFPSPPAGFPSPPAGGFASPPAGPAFPPAGGFQSPPTGSAAGSTAPAAGFPSPPWPGEFQGFQPPGIPGGQPPGFGGQQAEGFRQTAPFPGPQPGQPPFAGPQYGQMPFRGPAAASTKAAMPWYQRIGSMNPRLLVGGAAAVVVVVGGVVLAVPKLLGPSDPGCASYTGSALVAYNQTINDLNAQAPQAVLTNDMTSAIADLTTASDQAKSATVKSALDGLRSELTTVRADVQKGSVSAQTVTALNSASRAADNAC